MKSLEFKTAQRLSDGVRDISFSPRAFALAITNMTSAEQERIFVSFMECIECWNDHWLADQAHLVADDLGTAANHLNAAWIAYKMGIAKGLVSSSE